MTWVSSRTFFVNWMVPCLAAVLVDWNLNFFFNSHPFPVNFSFCLLSVLLYAFLSIYVCRQQGRFLSYWPRCGAVPSLWPDHSSRAQRFHKACYEINVSAVPGNANTLNELNVEIRQTCCWTHRTLFEWVYRFQCAVERLHNLQGLLNKGCRASSFKM